MEELYSIEGLSLREAKALRQGLDFIQISGIDAMFIGMLQAKLIDKIQAIDEKEKENNIPPPPGQAKKS